MHKISIFINPLLRIIYLQEGKRFIGKKVEEEVELCEFDTLKIGTDFFNVVPVSDNLLEIVNP